MARSNSRRDKAQVGSHYMGLLWWAYKIMASACAALSSFIGPNVSDARRPASYCIAAFACRKFAFVPLPPGGRLLNYSAGSHQDGWNSSPGVQVEVDRRVIINRCYQSAAMDLS